MGKTWDRVFVAGRNRAFVIPTVVGVVMVLGLLVGAAALRQQTSTAHREQQSRAAALEVVAAVNFEHVLAHDVILEPSSRASLARTLSLTRLRVAGHMRQLAESESADRDDRAGVIAVQRDVRRVESAVLELVRRASASESPRQLHAFEAQVLDAVFGDADRSLRAKVAADAQQADRAYATHVSLSTAIVLAMIAWSSAAR